MFFKKIGFWVFMVHPIVVSVLLSASVERCFVSRMRDFEKLILVFCFGGGVNIFFVVVVVMVVILAETGGETSGETGETGRDWWQDWW